MTGKTHTAVGMATALMVTRPTRPVDIVAALTLGAMGGLMPDIDVQTSEIAKIYRYISAASWVILLLATLMHRFDFGAAYHRYAGSDYYTILCGVVGLMIYMYIGCNTEHRTFTHSLLGTFLASFCVYSMGIGYTDAFAAGYVSHLILDLLNYRDVHILWPFKGFSLRLCSASGRVNSAVRIIALSVIALFLVGYVARYSFLSSIILRRFY